MDVLNEGAAVISIIVCSYNRDRMFEETVNSFLDGRIDGIDYELLLVDNNSTDKTRQMGEGFSARFHRIRYVNEPIQGLSRARNRGIRESVGDIVVFADDDVYFSPGWLEALVSTFERRPDVACIGGKVSPHFESDRPYWLEDELLDVYSITQYGDQERVIHPPEYPIGCNMAFRRAVFEKVGGFPTSLGRKPGNLLSNDEIYFLLCVEKAGLKTLYLPDAQVSHRILPDRVTQQWLRRRWYWQGISDVAMWQIADNPLSKTTLAKKAIKAAFDLLRQWKDMADLLRMSGGCDGSVRIRKQIKVCYKFGMLRQIIAESLAFRTGRREPKD